MAKKRADLSELGRTGLNQSYGYVSEEILPELSGLKWRRIVRHMTDNDAVINSILFAIEMLARRVTFKVETDYSSQDALKKQEFIRGALFDDMSQSWPDTVAEIMSLLPWGYSYLETVYKERKGESLDPSKNSRFCDGKTGWRKFAMRAQESLERWEFDTEGGVQGMWQRPAPYYDLRFVPIQKSLLFRTTVHKGNPEGRSIIRGAYRPFFRKWHIENIEGIGIERELGGLPVLYVPGEILTDDSDEGRRRRAEYEKIVTNVRVDEEAGMLLPSDADEHGTRLYEMKLLSTGGQRQFDTDKIIQRCDQRMAICVLADFILLGHTQKAGSYGMTDKKSELFSTAGDAWLDGMCAVINRHGIPRLLRLNGMRTDRAPYLTHNGMEKIDLAALGEYVNSLSGANISFAPVEQQFLKQQIKGMPVQEPVSEPLPETTKDAEANQVEEDAEEAVDLDE